MKFLFILLAAMAALAAPSTPATAKGKCVLVIPRQGDEALINTCDVCRVVEVTRSRAMGGVQGKRIYAVPAKAVIDLTFHGSGKTRIKLERPCGERSEKRSNNNETQCVKLKMLRSGQPGLVNKCPACRRVDVAYATPKSGFKREVFDVNPNAIKILNPPPGATDAVIARDRNCGGW